MNAKIIEQRIVWFIRHVTKGSSVVVGLSGGIDSSTVAALCVRALGKDKVVGLILPEKGLSKIQDVEDARELAVTLGIAYHIHPINDVLDGLKLSLPFLASNKSALGNAKARIRMMMLYSYANAFNYRVAGTGNKSELHVGYFAKYGDGGVDFLPIGDLVKHEVRMLATHLEIPSCIVDKTPTAGLWQGQTDEKELGFTYEELDNAVRGRSSTVAAQVKKMHGESKHKREMPPICVLR